MGAYKISIPIHGDTLRRLILKKGKLGAAAQAIGITRQMLHTWLRTGTIPPRRLIDLANYLNLTAEDVHSLKRSDPNMRELHRELFRLRDENKRLKAAIAELCDKMP